MNMLKECKKRCTDKAQVSCEVILVLFFFLHKSDDEFHVMIAKTCIS